MPERGAIPRRRTPPLRGVLESLAREDKWFLGGGRAAVYAPRFPLCDRTPGFWDPVHFADVPVKRLFAVHLADEADRPVRLEFEGREWRPDRLAQRYRGGGLAVLEERAVLGEDLFVSRLAVRSLDSRPRRLSLLVWTLQEKGPAAAGERAAFLDAEVGPSGATVLLEVRPSKPALVPRRARLRVEYASSARIGSWYAGVSQRAADLPLFEAGPFVEALREGRLSNEKALLDWENDESWKSDNPCQAQVAFCIPLRLRARAGASVAVGARLALEEVSGFPDSPKKTPVRRVARASSSVSVALRRDPIAASTAAWEGFLGSVPFFDCDDPHLRAFWWYRWYGIRLHAVDARSGFLRRPCVFEGIDSFRAHIVYSAQAHAREATWMRNPALAEGCLLGLLENLGPRGEIPGHIRLLDTAFDEPAAEGYPFPYRTTYLADLGRCVLDLYAVHGRREFLREVYGPLDRHAAHWRRDRDREGSWLFDVLNQCETGQEYSSRYLAVDSKADRWGPIRLKGVDATVYAYGLHRALAFLARELGDAAAAARDEAFAERIAGAVRAKLWDRNAEFFFDLDPRTGRRTPAKSAVGFYPFVADLAGAEHLGAIRRHFLESKEFWTPFPITTLSRDDARFDTRARWKGKRTNCPWNGRVWPMTNSHAADALARAAELDPALRPAAAEFLRRFVCMLFFDGNAARPNTYEHYDPETGAPSLYRGIDDYQHSWVNDLIVRHVAGLRPSPDGSLRVDPLPMGLGRFVLRGAPWRRREVEVSWESSKGLRLGVDGREVARRRDLGPLGPIR